MRIKLIKVSKVKKHQLNNNNNLLHHLEIFMRKTGKGIPMKKSFKLILLKNI